MIDTLPTSATPFQTNVLRYRKHCNIFNGGGRGSGKSVSLCFDILDHVRELGPIASVLVLRESWSGLMELQFKLFQLARIAFGPNVSQNKGSGTLTFPNGGIVHFRNVGDDDSFAAAQGKTYTMLAADEAGNYPLKAIQYMTMLRSNLRPPKGIRAHIHVTANPMGRAHTHFLRNFVNKAEPWRPYLSDEKEYWINCYSDLTDNPHIDGDAYRKQLIAATAGNPALQDAWVNGDWHTKGGGLMFEMFDPKVHIKEPPGFHNLRYRIGVDWGSASPSCATLLGELKSPMGNHLAGDVFAVDGVDTCIAPGNYHQGDGTPASVLAAMIKGRLLERYSLPLSTEIVVDNARGLTGSDTVVSIFHEQGLHGASPVVGKDRIGGFNRIRNLLDGAIHGDSIGLWFSAKCGGLIDTLQIAPRDDLRPEDLSRHWNEDHFTDSLVYVVQATVGGPKYHQSRVIGMY